MVFFYLSFFETFEAAGVVVDEEQFYLADGIDVDHRKIVEELHVFGVGLQKLLSGFDCKVVLGVREDE